MSSIRRRLILWLCSSAALCLPLGGLVIYWSAQRMLTAQFDETLMAKADALLSAVEVDDGRIELDLDIQEFAGFGSSSSSRGDYFEIYHQDGRTLRRSPSLHHAGHLAQETGAVVLPGGGPGRSVVMEFDPDEDEEGQFLRSVLVVASESHGLHRTLNALALILVIAGVSGVVVAVLILSLALRRGLQPLTRLAGEIEGIDVQHPDQQIRADTFPVELQGVGHKINDLLTRAREAAERERRFSSHAAHELRTPISELRLMIEMMGQWQEEATPERCRELIDIVDEMEALLAKMSLLTRAESGQWAVTPEPIQVREWLPALIARHQTRARQKGIHIDTDIRVEVVHTDAALWQTLWQNLLSNAIEYAPENTTVRVVVDGTGFQVSNAADNLTRGDVAHLFDRFWRKDTTRVHGQHSGLGLSIVKACARCLGAEVTAELSGEGKLTITVKGSSNPLATEPR